VGTVSPKHIFLILEIKKNFKSQSFRDEATYIFRVLLFYFFFNKHFLQILVLKMLRVYWEKQISYLGLC
jgi:hypothetical protein